MEAVIETKKGFQKTKIGWIPEDWVITQIGKHSKIDAKSLNGKTDPNYKFEYISLGDVNNGMINKNLEEITFKDSPSRARRVISKGDVLLATVRPNLKSFGFIDTEKKDTIASTGFAVISCKKELDSKFLFYNLFSHSMEGQFYALVVGSNYPAINSSDVKHLKIPLPPLPEQQKIAKILSTWDKAIEQSQKLIEQLKIRKKGLMQQLLTGKTRLKGFSGEWKKYQLGDLASNYNLINKDNKVQEVLSCTKYDGLVRSLEYFGRKVYGDDLSKYKVVPSGYFAYATNHIEEGSIGYQDKMDFGLVSPMYTVFKTNEKVDDSFFYKLLKTDRLIYYYQSNMSGSIARRGGLRWNAFETIAVEIPSIEEQQAIAKVLTTADNEIKVQETYLQQLQAQKKGLMQQLLTGQKRVKV